MNRRTALLMLLLPILYPTLSCALSAQDSAFIRLTPLLIPDQPDPDEAGGEVLRQLLRQSLLLLPVTPTADEMPELGLKISINKFSGVCELSLCDASRQDVAQIRRVYSPILHRVAVQNAEHMGRILFAEWLETAGLSPLPPQAADAPFPSLPPELSTYANSFKRTELAAMHANCARLLRDYNSPAVYAALARAYANLYLISAHEPTPAPKEYLARALLLAQRAKALYPGAVDGQFALAYVWTLCGRGNLAWDELDWARLEKPDAENEPEWAEALALFIKADLSALKNDTSLLAAYLRLLLLEGLDVPHELTRLLEEIRGHGGDTARIEEALGWQAFSLSGLPPSAPAHVNDNPYVNLNSYPYLVCAGADENTLARAVYGYDEVLYDYVRRNADMRAQEYRKDKTTDFAAHWSACPQAVWHKLARNPAAHVPDFTRWKRDLSDFHTLQRLLGHASYICGEDALPAPPEVLPLPALPEESDPARLRQYRYALERRIVSPLFFQERARLLDAIAALSPGYLDDEATAMSLLLIRDGGGLGYFRSFFHKLLRDAPEDSERNNWALHLRAGAERFEVAAFTRLRAVPTAAQESLLSDFHTTPGALALAVALRTGGDEASAEVIELAELDLYRLYARAFGNRPKGTLRGLQALADSPYTAEASLGYYRLLQESPEAELVARRYSGQEVFLCAACAYLRLGQHEEAALLLARSLTTGYARKLTIFFGGEVSNDPRAAQQYLLRQILQAQALTQEARLALEEAGAPALFPQIWSH